MPVHASAPPLPSTPGNPGNPSDETPETRWTAGPALVALITTFGVALFIGIPAIVIGEDTTTAKVIGNVVSSILQNAVFVGIPVLILVLMAVGRLRRRDFGLRMPPRPWVAVGFLVLAFFAYLALSAGLAALLGIGDQKDDLPEKLGAKDSVAAGIVIALCVTVLAPIGEEFLLRGVIYPGLRNSLRRISPMWVAVILAALIDGLIFGALHAAGSKAIFLPILALFGAVLCVLYQLTGSLYAPIVLHATNNTIAITTALGWKFSSGALLWVGAILILALMGLAARWVGSRLPPVGRVIPAAQSAESPPPGPGGPPSAAPV